MSDSHRKQGWGVLIATIVASVIAVLAIVAWLFGFPVNIAGVRIPYLAIIIPCAAWIVFVKARDEYRQKQFVADVWKEVDELVAEPTPRKRRRRKRQQEQLAQCKSKRASG